MPPISVFTKPLVEYKQRHLAAQDGDGQAGGGLRLCWSTASIGGRAVIITNYSDAISTRASSEWLMHCAGVTRESTPGAPAFFVYHS